MNAKTAVLYLLVFASQQTIGQVFREKINKELSFEKKGNNALLIFNVNGFVKVIGYEGDKIQVEVERVIHAKTEARLEKGKRMCNSE